MNFGEKVPMRLHEISPCQIDYKQIIWKETLEIGIILASIVKNVTSPAIRTL